ncbi:dienelactone hydrolase family protein [Burkholderia vietnamiensis]|uniref:dienelactone hydrolase family protein n=1 Tax=Burkholderia vietnamiensis TaxID=60552 RepID=UPI00075DF0B7|nr:dienelactone hydrolase family protein [Burkholderia vietnamiensis]KVE05460.1 carboxymethylenebutenolidase [Burkholderia vietnamiensis]MBR8164160.1 dienelactone hydrolase family protein [Burkholderia vietnamiensis]MCA8149556.1 dienelactone hydrolase family protein [Burkholderia vietnamiensis]MCA8270040.1 dienelactone hydrolase family protein [Burkholderia vietnamiensis]MCA8451289.1 dienelactone hydrolase family protein [Burkholderia vietnamiensis]
MTAQWIDIPTGSDSFGGYLALPKRGTGPAVVIIQEIFGVNAHIRAVADQYAADGFVALAPDVFWRTQPRVELTYDGADRDKGIELMKKTDIGLAVADIGAAADALRARADVAGKVAAIGYCFGGQLAYRAAAAGTVDAAVAYYGGGIQNALDLADKVTQPILFHYAENDHAIPLDAVEQVRGAFAGRGNASFHVYPDASHGFNCPDRASYHQRASALAHGRTLTFLAEQL